MATIRRVPLKLSLLQIFLCGHSSAKVRGGRYWHANGGEDDKGPMEVYLSTYDDFIKPDNSYNRKVFVVKIVD